MESTRKCWRCGEAIVNDPHCDPVPSDPWRARHPEWEECVHATRAALAQVERGRADAQRLAGTMSGLRDQGERAYDEQAVALAARDAECAELRAALDHLLREWLAWQPGITGVARTRAEAALSRPPGTDAALRAMMVKSWEAGYLRGCGGCNPTDGPPWDEDDCRNRDAAIARLLEPPAEARDGGAK